MTNDELRRKAFELECALGKAIKISEQLKDMVDERTKAVGKLCDINSFILGEIKRYVNTMDKSILLDLVTNTSEMCKNLKA